MRTALQTCKPDHDRGSSFRVCEALTYAKEKGLDLNVFSKSVATGAAGSRQFDLFGPKIIEKDYAPGFFMKHFIKDMKLALIEAKQKRFKSRSFKPGSCHL